MTDSDLMKSIREHWGKELAAAIDGTLIPEAFLAALVANESGGNALAERFEPRVFAELAEVVLGKRPSYNPTGISHALTRVEILNYVEPPAMAEFTDCLNHLAELATSRGLTQIMGWHAVELNKPLPSSLWAARDYLDRTVELLTYFANRYELALEANFAELLHCWNTGEPEPDAAHPTFDPHYVPNGLERMELYSKLAVPS